MKTLYIVRHAKSSWESPEQTDYKRPLLETGVERTKAIGNYLLNSEAIPELILCSHATRAFETAKILASILNYPTTKIVIDDKIYFGNAEDAFHLLYEQNNETGSIMLVGHNPTLTYMVNYFLIEKINNLPTSAVVCIDFETDKWEDLFLAPNTTRFLITPRLLEES